MKKKEKHNDQTPQKLPWLKKFLKQIKDQLFNSYIIRAVLQTLICWVWAEE